MDADESHLRKTRSQRDLINALLSLCQAREMKSITVRELCKEAQINRSTFYRRYESMAGFHRVLTRDFIHDMSLVSHHSNPFYDLLTTKSPRSVFEKMVVNMNVKNAAFLRSMIKSDPSDFTATLKSAWIHQLNDSLHPFENRFNGRIEVSAFSSCFSSSLFGQLSFHLYHDTSIDVTKLVDEMMLVYYEGMLTSLGLVPVHSVGRDRL